MKHYALLINTITIALSAVVCSGTLVGLTKLEAYHGFIILIASLLLLIVRNLVWVRMTGSWAAANRSAYDIFVEIFNWMYGMWRGLRETGRYLASFWG